MSGRVFFYVQHLLGVGHVRRAALLARAMGEAGLEVDLVSGGGPVPALEAGLRVHHLPPVRSADERFTSLVDGEGRPVDESYKKKRRGELLDLFASRRPDALILESYPFARRQMRFELLPLLEAAHALSPRPVIVSSVRDALQLKRKPERNQEIVDLVRTKFDHVLVHGDPNFLRLEDSFARAGEIADKLHYTGYVIAPEIETDGDAGYNEVIVSAGGGAVGEALLTAALDARAHSSLATAGWRLLAGSNMPDEAFDRLRARAADGIIVERARPDFAALLARCAVSVSQGGYNTVLDILRAGARAVIVPFAAGGETEQPLRAARLAERGLAQKLDEADLTPETLARAIDAALAAPPASAAGLDLDGAAASARLVAGWIGS